MLFSRLVYFNQCIPLRSYLEKILILFPSVVYLEEKIKVFQTRQEYGLVALSK